MRWTEWLRIHGFDKLFGIEQGQLHAFDEIEWHPTDADRTAAWKLYTELRTRITTQPLHLRAGDEATALDSVYRLFELSRSIIKEHDGCTHFATLTVRMLNLQVRRFTADWHGKKVDGRLSSADERFAFRRDLAQLQPRLRTFASLMGLLAGDNARIAEEEREPNALNPTTLSWLADPLPFGISQDKLVDGHAINTAEAREVLERRKYYGVTNAIEATDAVGLAISGGGIRSATFALGVVQTLARKGILRDVDFLSTVSGGGYLGAFISSFLNDADDRITLRSGSRSLPFGADGDDESQSVRHLRNHSKYLTQGGLKTIATIASLVVSGVIVSILLVAPLLLSAVLIANLVSQQTATWSSYASFVPAAVVGAALLTLGVLLPAIQTFSRNQRLKTWWGAACVCAAFVFVLLLLLGALPYLFNVVRPHSGMAVLSVALIAVVFAILGVRLGAQSIPGRIAFGVFASAGPLLFLFVFFLLCELFVTGPTFTGEEPYSLWVLAGLAAFSWVYASFILNINFASPHSYYRGRLARTYLTRNADAGAAISMCDPQLLSAMNSAVKAPYHLLNAALNIPACEDPNLRGRNTDFFLFSKHFCGSPIIGYKPTQQWESVDKHLDLGTAMAISGAAAAPHMGTLTSLRYTFLLAMLNVRLGYWADRPRGDAASTTRPSLPPVGWYYFFRELTGWMSEKTRYVNLSDGGHIENLGIYELLRRRCKFVIAIDGEADPARSFGGLLTLTQLAHIDLGVRIDPDLSDLRIDGGGKGRSHFGLSRIVYPGDKRGLLLYIKTSMTGNEPEFLKKYHAEHPDFPHESTAQQLFSETQFEAYRSLGEHVAGDLFRGDLVDNWQSTMRAHQWFAQLAVHLLET